MGLIWSYQTWDSTKNGQGEGDLTQKLRSNEVCGCQTTIHCNTNGVEFLSLMTSDDLGCGMAQLYMRYTYDLHIFCNTQ